MTGKAVIGFDLDGTLIDSAPSIAASVNAVLMEHGADPLEEDRIAGMVGSGAAVLIERVRAAREIGAQHQADLLDRYLAIDGAKTDQPLYDGARAALEVLAEEAALVLCTNKVQRHAAAILEAAGLAPLFANVIGGDSLPARKPDPAPLLAAFDGLGDGPRLFVGDSGIDAETARAAGVPFLFYSSGYGQAPEAALPHAASFAAFDDLPALVRDTLSERPPA
ncbi:HAD-IA family hydrolase [Wenxinia saemankumensis]|uniref:phosphoglycolate phosphatase n=1 Tax=Wenxinia saemankumensis TaxID=1447782 RepID=A0A1M6A3K6_9RHOB|nr:HAD-IA family hydrolase [Wenxinia saemankumensis]SHI31048.1 phosphoglycolate phosphatase [Wenxinia saemankumensis]